MTKNDNAYCYFVFYFFNSKSLDVSAYGGGDDRCKILILAYGCFPQRLNTFKECVTSVTV